MHRKLLVILLTSGIFISLSSVGQTTKVHFIIKGIAKVSGNPELFVAGNMNNWNPADSNYRFRKNASNAKLHLMVNTANGFVTANFPNFITG